MKNFKILTDSCCDLTPEMVKELDLGVAPLSVEMDGQSFPEGTMTPKELYDHLRSGKMPKTAAVNPQGWETLMKSALENGQDVLVIAFSSGLSATYQSAVIAADELGGKYPERKIIVIDSLSAAIGQGLLVWHAAQKRIAGEDIESVARWVEDNKLHVCHWVTVEDLMHLKRGGRVSATTAVVGTMLQIKPIIVVDDNGKLDTLSKSRGRRAALNLLVENFEKSAIPGRNDTVFVGHGDCLADAEYIAQQLKARGVKNVVINYVGAVIGSHTGPGVIVLGFLGQKR